MNPWELRTATDKLRDEWNNLHAQVVGRSITGRAEISNDMKNEIAASRGAFREWYEGLIDRPLEEALGLYNNEFQNQLSMYRKIATSTNQALKTLGEKPKYSTLEAWVERPSGFVPGFVVGVGILLVGWFLLQKKRKQ